MKRTLGIAGFGRAGRLYFDTLRANHDCTVLGIADPAVSPGSVGATPVFQNHLALLETDAEAILIATPPSSHFEIAEPALQAGRHVLVEKPPTRSVEQANQLRDLSKSAGTTLFFAYHARYNKAVDAARDELRSRNIQSFRAIYKENVLNFHDSAWVLGEGVLRDSGINILSILTKLLPSPNELRVVGADLEFSDEWHSDVRARLDLSAAGQYDGSIEMDWHYPGAEQRTIEIVTETGPLRIDIARGPETGLESEYKRMTADFLNCIESHESSCGTAELRLLQSAYELGCNMWNCGR